MINYHYYTNDGEVVSPKEIELAVKEKRAVICWSHGDWKNVGTLMIFNGAEEAEIEAMRDTRDECYSMAEEVWCHLAESVKQAKMAASGLLVQR